MDKSNSLHFYGVVIPTVCIPPLRQLLTVFLHAAVGFRVLVSPHDVITIYTRYIYMACAIIIIMSCTKYNFQEKCRE